MLALRGTDEPVTFVGFAPDPGAPGRLIATSETTLYVWDAGEAAATSPAKDRRLSRAMIVGGKLEP